MCAHEEESGATFADQGCFLPISDSDAQFYLQVARHPVPRREGERRCATYGNADRKTLTSIAITGTFAHAGCIRWVLTAPIIHPCVWEEEIQKFAAVHFMHWRYFVALAYNVI